MSRHYEMTVEISGHDPAKVSQIQAAAKEEWPFTDWWFQDEGVMGASAQDCLCGGETEEQFTERLSLAVWRANGSFCEVIVSSTFLENLPYEVYMLEEDDYVRLIQTNTRENEV